MQRYPAIAQSEGYLDSNAFATSRLPGVRSWVTDTILPSIPVDWRDLTGTGGRKWCTDLPQSVTEMTATSATNNWKQPESRIQTVMKIYGATTGHRNSYRYDFEAKREVSVTDCDGLHTYIRTNTRQLRHQD